MSKENKVLDLVMKSVWFEKIKNGEKNIEYREVKKYWGERMFAKLPGHKAVYSEQIVDKVLFSNGYKRKEQMLFKIKKIEILRSGINTDLHIDKPVYAIHLGKQLNIVEWKKQVAKIKTKIQKCKGEGQGKCSKCGQINWMCFLYEVPGLEGCYCRNCIEKFGLLEGGKDGK